MVQSSIPAVLRERASLQPNDTALTYVDYEQNWDGDRLTLSWSQLHRRVSNAAEHLKQHASAGDRAVIVAPQGLEYIIGFLASLHAGIVAVPLAVPYGGVHDERTVSVVSDSSPAVLITASSAMEYVAGFGEASAGKSAPAIVQLDLLDLDSRQSASGSRGRRTSDDGSSPLYLQYTSGSTRTPAGVVVSSDNLFANFGQLMDGFFRWNGKVTPPGATIVSWLPFYHDMGFFLGIIFPILAGVPAVLTSPVGFLQRPARWLQLMASSSRAISAAPNFAYEVAARKTSDDDMQGVDLGGILHILNGAERVQPVTLKRFTDRFAPFNLDPAVLRPSYGMAEATVYVATRKPGEPPKVVEFDSEKLPAGQAESATGSGGTALVSYGIPEQQTVRIVDPDTGIERSDATVGEIWLHGRNVCAGYWQKPEESERTFGGRIMSATNGAPEGPWLRTGDSGFLYDGELYIIGRIKDLLIVYGRNHSPDDIEATIQEVIPGRCAAIAVPDHGAEKLVAIIELKKRGDSAEADTRFRDVKRDVTSAISLSHGLKVADLVLVSPGSIPITTSGKVRRAQCVELYRQNEFARLDS